MEQKTKEVKIQIKGSDTIMGGTYANHIMVHMNREEFVLDFINVVPPHATLNSRIVLSPNHFKRMLATMARSLKKFEDEFGKLPEPQQESPSAEFVQ